MAGIAEAERLRNGFNGLTGTCGCNLFEWGTFLRRMASPTDAQTFSRVPDVPPENIVATYQAVQDANR